MIYYSYYSTGPVLCYFILRFEPLGIQLLRRMRRRPVVFIPNSLNGEVHEKVQGRRLEWRRKTKG
jgi:hypothetical protein